MTDNEIERLGFAMLPNVPRGEFMAFAHAVLAQARNVTDRELLQQALDALVSGPNFGAHELIDALRARLAQPDTSNQLSGNSGELNLITAPVPGTISDGELLRIATTIGLPFGILDTDYCKAGGLKPGTRSYGEVTCDGIVRFARAAIAAAAPAVAVPFPLTAQEIKDIARSTGHVTHNQAWEIAELLVGGVVAATPAVREPLTVRELQLIDGMIDVQLHHAAQCDGIANRTMADKQKGWDMERVELLRKLRGITGDSND